MLTGTIDPFNLSLLNESTSWRSVNLDTAEAIAIDCEHERLLIGPIKKKDVLFLGNFRPIRQAAKLKQLKQQIYYLYYIRVTFLFVTKQSGQRTDIADSASCVCKGATAAAISVV
jgi:hypothetical protein